MIAVIRRFACLLIGHQWRTEVLFSTSIRTCSRCHRIR